ncbi:MAG TPA: c-type cytochrome [Caulobacteraceae bacterium]|nr:c-type cytochrome [Caulobacteraceae bacterium]
MAEPFYRRERWSFVAGAIVAAVSLFSIGFGLFILPVLQAPNAGIDPWTAICRAMGVKPGTPAQPQPPVSAVAAPVSQVRWTPKTLAVLAAADPRPGAALSVSLCSACHGDQGVSPSPLYPHLSGQSAEAIFKQLSDFRSGARVNPMMSPVAQGLTEDQLAEVAAYYAHYTRNAVLGARYEVPDPEMARLAHRGDPSRRIPPCEACHARGVGGAPEAPVLWGQQQAYLQRQLDAFASGDRHNDVYRRMRDIAQRLTPDERARLAEYYQGLR